jgi:hypothetical protein
VCLRHSLCRSGGEMGGRGEEAVMEARIHAHRDDGRKKRGGGR